MVGRPRPRSADGFGRGLTTSGRDETLRRGGTPQRVEFAPPSTLTMRHAEPEGFCGRGSTRGPLGDSRPEEPATAPEWVGGGAREGSPARTAQTHHYIAPVCPARGACGTSDRGRARRGMSRWRVPVCCYRNDVCWMGTEAGIRMMGAWWMPWRWRPTKDAATRRNAPGRRWQPVIRGSPNGATRPAHGRAPRHG